MRPMNNSGGHVWNAMRPPDFRTRSISWMATSGRGAKMWANWLSTTSNSPSRKGRLSTSPCFQVMSSSSAIAAFSLATARSSGVRSKPVTAAPARRAVIATTPVPHPTSSTRWFGRTPAKCTSFAALGVVVMASGANVFQFSRCIALNAWNGSEVMFARGRERVSVDNASAEIGIRTDRSRDFDLPVRNGARHRHSGRQLDRERVLSDSRVRHVLHDNPECDKAARHKAGPFDRGRGAIEDDGLQIRGLEGDPHRRVDEGDLADLIVIRDDREVGIASRGILLR